MYISKLNTIDTENAIKFVKDTFQKHLANKLNLQRVTAPLFVKSGLGINDDLSGSEKPVSFIMKHTGEQCEIVHSLAKWKRMKLHELNTEVNHGIYTDMNAIRTEETLDNIHSLYVDQWDWEAVIKHEERCDKLYEYVKNIYDALLLTEDELYQKYNCLEKCLPSKFKYITAEELYLTYPDLTPKQREYEICKKYGAVFICGIGGKLSNGEVHDLRAPDYDDWCTPKTYLSFDIPKNSIFQNNGLNGDLLIWYEPLDMPIEISSMGVRVDKDALELQCYLSNTTDRLKYKYHQMILNNELPQTIGGGIGQSRLCMILLKKLHIGEVQSSVWPDEIINECKKNNINIL
jgi:aspartate--ammonia ligase